MNPNPAGSDDKNIETEACDPSALPQQNQTPEDQRLQQDRLQSELSTLHQLLEDVEEVDPTTKEAMQSVAEDIRRLIEGGSTDDSASIDAWSHLGNRWRAALVDFESQHPRLTQAVDQITGLLANIGF